MAHHLGALVGVLIGSFTAVALSLWVALRARKDELSARHIRHLWVFGSVARGEERDDSDIDLLVELDPEAKLSLTAFARLQLDLTDWLGRRTDLATWKTLRDYVVEEARRDAVLVF